MNLPPHVACHITHNEHALIYNTVEAHCLGHAGYSDEDWISAEQRQKAIATNDCWSIAIYDKTPVGFFLFHAADLDALLQHVEMVSKEWRDDNPDNNQARSGRTGRADASASRGVHEMGAVMVDP